MCAGWGVLTMKRHSSGVVFRSMTRRDFHRAVLYGSAASAACSTNVAEQDSPQTERFDGSASQSVVASQSIVRQLRQISAARRQQLFEMPAASDVLRLNQTIPEINDIELSNDTSTVAPKQELRVIAWNMERGRHWRQGVQLIREHDALRDPDIILLGEMDLGMARSANEHTAREMARALGMNYAYGVEFLELTKGEPQEREMYAGENSWGYHGNAILSRYQLSDLSLVRFPGIEKWFGHFQKRLGGRMALCATLQLGRPVRVISTHLETSSQDAETRSLQGKLLLQHLEPSGDGMPTLLGGDLNAPPNEPVIQLLRESGFLVDECNQLSTPTRQRIRDENLVLTEAHIDYICARGLDVISDSTSPRVVPAVYPPEQLTPSAALGDHAIVTAKVSLPWL